MPEALPIPPLEAVDEVQMNQLIGQESFTINGQRLKMQLVETFVRDRWETARARVRARLASLYPERVALEAEVDRIVQPIAFRHIDLGDGRFNLIVEKGMDEFEPGTHDGDEGPVRQRPALSVLSLAHIDTVKGSHLSLERVGDRWEGLGAYDMQAAVLNNIALAVDVHIPDGMKGYFAFSVDEEMHSRGIRLMMDKWERFPEIDYVVTSEIGPVPPYGGGEKRMRIIAARAGRQKFVANVNVRPDASGHMSLGNLPNATDAMAELLVRMKDRFNTGYQEPGMGTAFEPPLQRLHRLLGKSEWESGKFNSEQGEGYIPPHAATYYFAIKTVPPDNLAEMEKALKRIARGIAKRGNWRDHGIDLALELNANQASYAPYEMPEDHPIVRVTQDIVQRVTGVAPMIVGAPSVADECDLAERMLKLRGRSTFAGTNAGIITLPINGDLAHNPGEWVSRMDTARVRFATKMLFEDPQGLQKLMRGPGDRK